jgi:hypothetical protein
MRGFRWFVDLHKSRSWNPRSLVPGKRHALRRLQEPYAPLPGGQPLEPRIPPGAFQTGPNIEIILEVRFQKIAMAYIDELLSEKP